MDSTGIAVAIGGLLQPYIRALVARWTGGASEPNGKASYLATVIWTTASVGVSIVAVWATGGFADIRLPAFTLADPSPLLAYLWPRWAGIYALSNLVWGARRERIEAVAAGTGRAP